MDISDELIGCYIEGTCTSEELQAVRDYLVKNPDEYDRILCLMDNYRDCHIEPETSSHVTSSNDNDYLDFSLASAAFIPFDSSSPTPPDRDGQSTTIHNLNRLWDEIDTI